MANKDKKSEKLDQDALNNNDEEIIIDQDHNKEEKKEDEASVNEINFEAKLQEEKEKYLRLYSDFENFRRRTSKERLDYIQSAGKEIILSILPVIDDFERALKAIDETSEESKALKEGVQLIYNKLYKILEKEGLKPIDSDGEIFDPEKFEAVTQIPAPNDDLKGKVVDTLEKGYYLGDKVLRFSKVVIGN